MVFSYRISEDWREHFLTAFSKNLQSHAHPTTTSEEQLPPTASLEVYLRIFYQAHDTHTRQYFITAEGNLYVD